MNFTSVATMPVQRLYGRMKRRRRGGSSTVNYDSDDDGAGQPIQYRHRKKTFGRFIKGQAKVNKLVRSQTQNQFFRFQALSPFETAGGKLNCNYQLAGGTDISMPLYMFDLTSTENVTNTGDKRGRCGLRCIMDNSTATAPKFKFSPVNEAGLHDGTQSAVNNWFALENTAGPRTPHRREMIRWIQGKIMLYGTLNRAVRWRLEIIQIDEDYLAPEWQVLTTANQTTTDDKNQDYEKERNAFYQYLLKPYTFSPLNIQDPRLRSKYKVLQTICDTTIEPKLTNEPAADGTTAIPHMVQQDWFYKMDRLVNYDWNDVNVCAQGTGVGALADDAAGRSYQQNLGEVKTTAEPRARVYLMMRAMATRYNNTANRDLRFDPSFDIMMRKKTQTFE